MGTRIAWRVEKWSNSFTATDYNVLYRNYSWFSSFIRQNWILWSRYKWTYSESTRIEGKNWGHACGGSNIKSQQKFCIRSIRSNTHVNQIEWKDYELLRTSTFLHILVSLLIRFGSTQCAISLQTTRVFGGNLLIFYEVKIAKQSDFGSILKHFLRNLALEKSLWSPKIDIELDLFVQKWKSSEKKVGMVCQCDGDLFGHVSAYFDCCVVEHAWIA